MFHLVSYLNSLIQVLYRISLCGRVWNRVLIFPDSLLSTTRRDGCLGPEPTTGRVRIYEPRLLVLEYTGESWPVELLFERSAIRL